MEISVEMTKAVGTEMAKLISEKIPEEELLKTAKVIWDKLNASKYNAYTRSTEDPEIMKFVKEVMFGRIKEKVIEILKEPVADEILEERARDIIEKARKATEEAIIVEMTKNMVNASRYAETVRENDIWEAVKRTMEMWEARRNNGGN